VLAIWMAAGLSWIGGRLEQKFGRAAWAAVTIAGVALVGVLVSLNWQTNNRRDYTFGRDYAKVLLDSFDPNAIVGAIMAALAGPGLWALQARLAGAQHRAGDVLSGLHLPQLPTRHEILARAKAMFAETPSMEDIVNRAHAVILEGIGARLCAVAAGSGTGIA
jgi:stearoyl-CoA desaturase (delta-9 desaturase)